MSEQSSFGLQWQLSAVQLATGAGVLIMSAAGYSLANFAGNAETAWAWAACAGITTALTGTAITYWFTRSVKHRLWDAGDLAERIARGDYRARLDVEAGDEIGMLEEQMNRMADQLEQAVGGLKALAEQNRLLAEEAGRGAALEERARLARELHDTVNQQLFALALRLAAAGKQVQQLGPGAAPLLTELVSLEDLARQAHGETRGLILQLRPTTLEQHGLAPALAEYLRNSVRREGLDVIDEIDPSVRIAGNIGTHLFRIAQEALHNAAKHAGANTIWVSLRETSGSLTLSIRDDGQGFDPKASIRPTAVGLTGMQERMRALGGTLRIISAPGEGTEISATVRSQDT